MCKKKKRVKFTIDDRSFTTLEEMEQEGHFPPMGCGARSAFHKIPCRNPETGEEKIIIIPKNDPPRRRLDE